MNLLLVRHAESKGNASGDYSVLSHDSLSCQGEEQASSLACCLRMRDFDEIIVSPLQRALETIAPYFDATHQRAEIWPEIAEACWQEREEKPSESWNTQPASVPDQIARFFAYRNDEALKPADPESFGQGLRRVHEAVQRIQEMVAKPDHSVLMITHGHFIRELLNLILDTRRSVSFPHDNCGMTSLTFDRVWSLNFCNRSIDMMRSNKPDADDGK